MNYDPSGIISSHTEYFSDEGNIVYDEASETFQRMPANTSVGYVEAGLIDTLPYIATGLGGLALLGLGTGLILRNFFSNDKNETQRPDEERNQNGNEGGKNP